MPIPNVSSKHCPTLNHLFVVPSSHQRNFVLENKQFVRNKSKQQQRQQPNSKNNQIPVSNYAIQTEGQSHLGRSSGRSSSRLNGGKEPIRDIPLSGNFSKTYLRQKNRDFQAPFPSNEKVPQKTSKSVPLIRGHLVTRTTTQKAANRSTQNVAVQTEEIDDEIYLYTALKKCASPAFKSALKAKYLQKDEEAKQKTNHHTNEAQYPPDEGLDLHQVQQSNHPESVRKVELRSNSYDKNINNPALGSSKYKSRSQTNPFAAGDCNPPHTDVNDQFNVMSLPPEMRKICEPNACTNCPEGYHLLTEKEREHIRVKLVEHETLLIKQLNSFPLAIETLRVRQSKTRIEHELSMLEQSLRKLTKKKIYVKLVE